MQYADALSSGNYQLRVTDTNGIGLCIQYAANGYAATSICTNSTSFTFVYNSASGYFTSQAVPAACLCPTVSLFLDFELCSSICTWTVASDGTIRTTAAAFATSTNQCIAGSGATPYLQACASLTTAYYGTVVANSTVVASPPSPAATLTPTPPSPSSTTTSSPTPPTPTVSSPTGSSVSGSSPTAARSTPNTASSSSSSGSSSVIVEVVGGILGGVVVAAICIGTYCRRRQRSPELLVATGKTSWGDIKGGPSSALFAEGTARVPQPWAKPVPVAFNLSDQRSPVAPLAWQQRENAAASAPPISSSQAPQEMDSKLLLRRATFQMRPSPDDEAATAAVLAETISMCKTGVIFANRYTLTGDYAKGSDSIVCHAEHLHSKVKVVIKMYTNDRSYQHELEAYQMLSNRYVARLEEPVVAGAGWPAALVLERGDYTLADWLKRTRPDALVQKVVLSQVLQALSSLHQQGIVHNDLKPANVMWFADSHSWKLIDVGNWTRSGQPLSAPFTYTLGYAAPELIKSEVEGAASAALHTSADMWAFGVIAYEVMTGLPFFGSGTPDDTVYTMLAGRWTLPTEKREGGSLEGIDEPQARRLLAHLLKRDPAARWSAPHAISNAWFKSAADTAQVAALWGGLRQQIAAVHRMTEVTAASLASSNTLICVNMEQFDKNRPEVMLAEEDNMDDPIFMLLIGHVYQINISVCHEKGQMCPIAQVLSAEMQVPGGTPMVMEVTQTGETSSMLNASAFWDPRAHRSHRLTEPSPSWGTPDKKFVQLTLKLRVKLRGLEFDRDQEIQTVLYAQMHPPGARFTYTRFKYRGKKWWDEMPQWMRDSARGAVMAAEILAGVAGTAVRMGI